MPTDAFSVYPRTVRIDSRRARVFNHRSLTIDREYQPKLLRCRTVCQKHTKRTCARKNMREPVWTQSFLLCGFWEYFFLCRVWKRFRSNVFWRLNIARKMCVFCWSLHLFNHSSHSLRWFFIWRRRVFAISNFYEHFEQRTCTANGCGQFCRRLFLFAKNLKKKCWSTRSQANAWHSASFRHERQPQLRSDCGRWRARWNYVKLFAYRGCWL